MSPNLELQRAERSLRAIRALAESALTGKITLTHEPVFDAEQCRYYWRTVMGLIWSHAHEGLGEDIPTPPPWPEMEDKGGEKDERSHAVSEL